MGTVYEAVDTVLGRRVALKLIVADRACDPGFRAGFLREARAQAALDSPHVVQVFAYGEVGGRLYLASQLIPDGDLGAALRAHGPLPPAEAAELVAQVADGLAEAHRAGLVHRDVKPANVLLRRRGPRTVAYLADFGIAGRADDEHAHGVEEDLRALGRVLGSCLTGRTPYDGGPVPRLPRALDRVLRAALTGRLPATALRDELRVAAAAVGPARRRLRPGVAAALVLAIAGAIALTAPDGGGPAPGDGASLATSLERDAALDPAAAACTARALAGADRLADVTVDAALAAAAACLWPERTRR